MNIHRRYRDKENGGWWGTAVTFECRAPWWLRVWRFFFRKW